MKIKKILAVLFSVTLTATGIAGCGSGSSDSVFDSSSEIVVVSREEGSGTRGAFIELTGVEQKDGDGNKIDMTTDEAIITNSTSAVMTGVSEDEYAIGYISLGSLNDTVKAVTVEGVEATADNINNGTYSLARPFNIVTTGDTDPLAQDFIDFILSEEGQAVISENGYIEVENSGGFSGGNVSGNLVIAGSSSVTPVMEKLKEAYEEINGSANIEIQESDSTTGITMTAEGTCQIGMASRELKDGESGLGLTSTVIAMDGITVIVNTDNPTDDLSIDDIKDIFCGNITEWEDVQ